MIPPAPLNGLFNHDVQNSLKREIKRFRTVKFAKHASIYSCGDKGENVYFIESGQIKIQSFTPAGKECLLAIYIYGDIFGESCLSGSDEYTETATAMEDSVVKVIPRSEFFLHLTREALLESFVKYLAVRVANQQRIITDLITADSEHRLAKTLLELAKKLGGMDCHADIIKHKFTHEELSMIVGTTRPRISQFIQKFRKLDLIEITPEHFIVVKKENLTAYFGNMSE